MYIQILWFPHVFSSVNGICNQSDLCSCESGWTGDSYETEIVADTSSSLSGSGIYYIRIHFQL